MKGSTHYMLSAAALASLLALAAGVAQAASALPSGGHGKAALSASTTVAWCERYDRTAAGGQDGRLVTSHIVRDGQGCIIGP